MAAKTLLCIGIGGFAGLECPGPGASIARALRAGANQPLRIVASGVDGVLANAWLPGVADSLRTVPDAVQDPDGFADAILRLARTDRIVAYLPGSTAEVLALARRHGSAFGMAHLAVPLPSWDTARRLTRVGQLQFLQELGIPTPPCQLARGVAELRLVADQIGYPAVILGKTSGAALANNRKEAEIEARRLGLEQGVLLRRLIQGDGFSAALVGGSNGRMKGIVVIRRLLADPLGQPASGVVIEEEAVRMIATRIQKSLGWRGPLEIELLRPAGSKHLLVLDIRPTLPNWSMVTHWAGCNLPALALGDILGAARHARPSAGLLFIRGVDEAAASIDTLRLLPKGIDRTDPHGPQGHHAPCRRNAEGLRVAVTGLGAFEVVNPGLGAARALRGAPGIGGVYGLGYGSLEAGVYQADLFDACFQIPANGSQRSLLERIATAHAGHPFDVLIPCMDQELPRFMEIQQELRDLGIAMLLPSKRAFDSRAKLALFSGKVPSEWGGFSIPESRIARSEAEAARAAAAIGVPCVLKGPLARCIPARSLDQVRSAWSQLRSEGAERAIVQQLVEGEIFATAAVCDRQQRIIARTTIKKLATCRRGSTWSAIHVPHPALEESFGSFLQHIGWVGPVEGEFIRDRITDRFYLFEVNPRFTAWIGFTAALGSNHPLLTVLAALDREIPRALDSRSAVFMRSSVEVLVAPAGLAAFSTRGLLIHARHNGL